MQKIQLSCGVLTSESFAPFGHVIEAGLGSPMMINEGTTERYHDMAPVDVRVPPRFV